MIGEIFLLGAGDRTGRACSMTRPPRTPAERPGLLALHEHSAAVQDALATALFDAYFRDGVNVANQHPPPRRARTRTRILAPTDLRNRGLLNTQMLSR